MAELTPEVRALIEAPNLGHFVTLMKDGSPQVTPLWVDHDGTHVLINTAEGRQKPRNLRRTSASPSASSMARTRSATPKSAARSSNRRR